MTIQALSSSPRSVTQEIIDAIGKMYYKNVVMRNDIQSSPLPFPKLSMGDCKFTSNQHIKVFDPKCCNTKYVRNVLVSFERQDRAYLLGATLQKAIFGRVVRARVLSRCPGFIRDTFHCDWQITDNECAIKVMEWSMINGETAKNNTEDPLTEAAAMQYLRDFHHLNGKFPDNIVSAYEILTDVNAIYVVMPFYEDGDLFEYLERVEGGFFTENEARYWMDQISNGVKCLHSAGVCHRDLSLENILVSGAHCSIIDLGMCLRVGVDNSSQPEKNGTRRSLKRQLLQPQGSCGKLFYMAPEIYTNDGPFDPFAIDVWSLGVILFMMLVGSVPFEKPCSSDKGFQWVTGGKLRRLLIHWGRDDISEEAIDLLERMLTVNFEERISLEDVFSHQWFRHQMPLLYNTYNDCGYTANNVVHDATISPDIIIR